MNINIVYDVQCSQQFLLISKLGHSKLLKGFEKLF